MRRNYIREAYIYLNYVVRDVIPDEAISSDSQ